MITLHEPTAGPKTRISKDAVIQPPLRANGPDAEAFSAFADAAVDPLLGAALAMKTDAEITTSLPMDATALTAALKEKMARIEAGDQRPLREMLFGQACTLQAQFVQLSRRASAESKSAEQAKLIGLALRSQEQSRVAIEMLVELARSSKATSPAGAGSLKP